MSKTQVRRKSKQAATRSPWPFVVMAVGAVLIVTVGLTIWRGSSKQTIAAPQVTGNARLQVDRDGIDFGKVPLDQPVKAVFKLSNVGDRTLRILGEPRVELVEGC